MNKRILIKQLGLKSTMKLRDLVGFRIDEDRREDFNFLRGFLDVEYGDLVTIITCESPKLKKKEDKQMNKSRKDKKYGVSVNTICGWMGHEKWLKAKMYGWKI